MSNHATVSRSLKKVPDIGGSQETPMSVPMPLVARMQRAEIGSILHPPALWATAAGGSPHVIQPKFTLGRIDDKYERESDRVAEQVVGQINNSTNNGDQPAQHQGLPDQNTIARKPLIQRMESHGGTAVDANVETGIQQALSGGRPLPDTLRMSMEKAFSADFSEVKVHTDGKSDWLNRAIQAKAFTTGADVFFRMGEYNPASLEGQELIAHELTHVVQQASSRGHQGMPTQATLQRQPVGWVKTKPTGWPVPANLFDGAYADISYDVTTNVWPNVQQANAAYAQMTFATAWATPMGRVLIQQQAAKQYANENTDFLVAVEGFRSAPTPTYQEARHLYNTFIVAGNKQVNLAGSRRQVLDNYFA